MIKNLLLKLAYKINKHYKAIEINYEDCIKFNGKYFAIVKYNFTQELDCVDTLEITAHDVTNYIDKIKG